MERTGGDRIRPVSLIFYTKSLTLWPRYDMIFALPFLSFMQIRFDRQYESSRIIPTAFLLDAPDLVRTFYELFTGFYGF